MKVLLFGASGNLGKEIAKELLTRNYNVTLVVRNEDRAKSLKHICNNFIVVDVCNSDAVHQIPKTFDVIISALGKSVSPNDKSKASFWDVDFHANINILNYAIKSGVKKFVYISAFHSEKYLHLDYFKVHYDFSEKLKESGLNYSIIKPPAIFSAFIDMLEMAKKGNLVSIGKGDKKTNPIYEGDLAKITIDSIHETNLSIEAGGKCVYTRQQINEIIQQHVDKTKKIRKIPIAVFKIILAFIKPFNKNTYNKFAFFVEVVQHDTIAPKLGEMSLEEYLKLKS